MKLTLKNGTILDVQSVEESYYPRNTQGVVLSVRLNTDDGIEALREIFTPEALESVTVGQGEDASAILGYTQIDSIRRVYGGDAEYNTTVDLVKLLTAEG